MIRLVTGALAVVIIIITVGYVYAALMSVLVSIGV